MESPLKVYVDQGANLKVLRKLQAQEIVVLYQNILNEAQFDHVGKLGSMFTIGTSSVGGIDMICGDNMQEIASIMGHQNYNDFQHIYIAYLARCDYFVTENPRDFIYKGKRELLEKNLGVKIQRTNEFLNELSELQTTNS